MFGRVYKKNHTLLQNRGNKVVMFIGIWQMDNNELVSVEDCFLDEIYHEKYLSIVKM